MRHNALVDIEQKDGRKFQALGGVVGHKLHFVSVFLRLAARGDRCVEGLSVRPPVGEGRKALRRGLDFFQYVKELALFDFSLLGVFPEKIVVADFAADVGNGLGGPHARERSEFPAEAPQALIHPVLAALLIVYPEPREALPLHAHGLAAYVAVRPVHDAQQVSGLRCVARQAQIGEEIPRNPVFAEIRQHLPHAKGDVLAVKPPRQETRL